MRYHSESVAWLRSRCAESQLILSNYQYMKDCWSCLSSYWNLRIRCQNHNDCWHWMKHWRLRQHISGRHIRSWSMGGRSVEDWWQFALTMSKSTTLDSTMDEIALVIIWSSVIPWGHFNQRMSGSMLLSTRWMRCHDHGMYKSSCAERLLLGKSWQSVLLTSSVSRIAIQLFMMHCSTSATLFWR